jgi:hypothetical protein
MSETENGSTSEIGRGEDGRPMLDFPSMDDLGSKSTETRTLPPEPDSPAAPAKEATDEFFYNPDSGQEEMNQHYSMGRLNALWGSRADDNIKIAMQVLATYGDDDVIAELQRDGTGSHHLIIEKVFGLLERLKTEYTDLHGPAQITGANMGSVVMKQFGQRAKELLNREIHDARQEVIQKHGAISLL